MAFVNAVVEIRLGNVESRLVGPAPREALDRALNAGLVGAPADAGKRARQRLALVYHAGTDVFLTGALGAVKRALRASGVRYRVRDCRTAQARCAPGSLTLRLEGRSLRDYQLDVVETALRRGHGLVDIGTGGGKTLLAAAIVARLSLPTLYLVTTRTLLRQTVAYLQDYLGVVPGVVGEGERDVRPLTVGLIQSFVRERTDPTPWRGGTLVFDEGHHAAAATYQDVVRRVAPRYHFYLSAVPFRPGRDQVLLDALAGKPLTGGRYSARFLIEQGYACPVRVRIERCVMAGDMTERPFTSIYKECIVHNEARNRRIAEIALAGARAGRSVLVLVEHVEHGRAILGLAGPEAAFVHGSTPASELHGSTERFARGDVPCLIATCGLLQEGVSIDGIEVLVAAAGLKSKTKVIQALGRGMRLRPGKASCEYVDFWDDDRAGILRAHSRQRLRILKEEGFLVPSIPEPAREAPDREIRASWAHVAGTRRFALVDAEGRVRGRAECLARARVPELFCERCKDPSVCLSGGRILWQEDQG